MSSAVGQVKLALSAEFLEAFSKLEKKAQARVRRFMTEFQQNPDKPGFNFEKIHTAPDGNLRSVRISDDYRGILLKPDSGDVFVFLWVDKHDDAYKWAEGRRVSIHPQTGTIQIFPTEEAASDDVGVETSEEVMEDRTASSDHTVSPFGQQDSGPRLFDPYSDEELVRIGVPEELIGLVRSVRDEEDFVRVRRRFPAEAAEALEYLSAGIPYSEVLDELGLSAAPEPESVDTSDFSAALDNTLSRRSVMVISSDQELQDALDYPLEKWRIFLHPQQQRLVNVNATGPYRIHGGAGTGKTVIAMHRARKLVRDFFPEETDRVLFTTFNRNLANDIGRNLETLCTTDEWQRIEVAHIDGWANQFLKRLGYKLVPVDAHKRRELWNSALTHKDESLGLSDDFFLVEWDTVIQEQGIRSNEEYLTARRTGAGTRLSRRQRMGAWPVFERYRELLSQENRLEFVDILRMAREKLEAGERPQRYAAVIIDEAQDMHPEAFRLARAIVARPYEEIPANSLFIVGDGHQRIYRNPTRLSDCGIPIVGRSRRLKLNYRTTEQTRRFAAGVLSGQRIADLDGQSDSLAGYTSLLQGDEPIEQAYESVEQEAAGIREQVAAWLQNDLKSPRLSGVCVVARSGEYIDSLRKSFESLELPVCIVTRDGEPKDHGVRLATMHRVKGIEYDYIVIAGADSTSLPERKAIDRPAQSEAERRSAMLRERSLLYVALTRARKAVLITWVGERSPLLP